MGLLNRKGNPGKLAVAIIQRKVMLVVAVSQQSNLFHVPSLVHVGHTNPCPGTQLQGNNCKNTIVTIIVIIKQNMQTYQIFFFKAIITPS